MDLSRRTELLEGVVNQLIDEEALGVCLEMHRAIKLGYYELLYPDDNVYDKRPVVEVKGLDIFGSSPQAIKKNIDCICPNCHRTLGAQKFAPHLEKCMGMGRNSSRLAVTKKQKPAVDSDREQSDDEDEWTYPEGPRNSKGTPKKLKKEAAMPSAHKSGRGPGRPPKQHKEKGQPQSHGGGEVASNMADFHSIKPSQMMHTVHSFKALPEEYKISLLDQICGVVSERTGRLCTRSVNCPQHLEEQRTELRSILLPDKRKSMDITPPPTKKSRSARRPSPDHTEEMEVEDSFQQPSSRVHAASRLHLLSSPPPDKKKRNKSSKKSKQRHNVTTTVLHSSPMY